MSRTRAIAGRLGARCSSWLVPSHSGTIDTPVSSSASRLSAANGCARIHSSGDPSARAARCQGRRSMPTSIGQPPWPRPPSDGGSWPLRGRAAAQPREAPHAPARPASAVCGGAGGRQNWAGMDTGQLELRSAVAWRDGRLEAIDQTLLPERLVVLELRTVAEVVGALRRLAIRGAPAIGVAAAFGVVLGLDERRPRTAEQAGAALDEIAAELEAARPTAVNLSWAVRRVVAAARGADRPEASAEGGAGDASQMRRRALEEARRVLEEDRAACRRMAEFGRAELAGRRRL